MDKGLREKLNELTGEGRKTLVLTLRAIPNEVAEEVRMEIANALGSDLDIISIELAEDDGTDTVWEAIEQNAGQLKFVLCVNPESEINRIRRAGASDSGITSKIPDLSSQPVDLSTVPVVRYSGNPAKDIEMGVKEREYFLSHFIQTVRMFNTALKFSLAALPGAFDSYFEGVELEEDDQSMPSEMSQAIEKLRSMTEYVEMALPNIDVDDLNHFVNNNTAPLIASVDLLRRYIQDSQLIQMVENLLKQLDGFLNDIFKYRSQFLSQDQDIDRLK